MNRCLKDIFGYCSGTPDSVETEGYFPVFDYQGLWHKMPAPLFTCRLDPRSCNCYYTFTDIINRLVGEKGVH